MDEGVSVQQQGTKDDVKHMKLRQMKVIGSNGWQTKIV